MIQCYEFYFSVVTLSLLGITNNHYIYVYILFCCWQLLGLLGNLKGITSDLVASECVLKLLNEGQIEFINKSEPQQLTLFATHFISNTDQAQSCNFATFLPIKEDTPLQVCVDNTNNKVTHLSIYDLSF